MAKISSFSDYSKASGTDFLIGTDAADVTPSLPVIGNPGKATLTYGSVLKQNAISLSVPKAVVTLGEPFSVGDWVMVLKVPERHWINDEKTRVFEITKDKSSYHGGKFFGTEKGGLVRDEDMRLATPNEVYMGNVNSKKVSSLTTLSSSKGINTLSEFVEYLYDDIDDITQGQAPDDFAKDLAMRGDLHDLQFGDDLLGVWLILDDEQIFDYTVNKYENSDPEWLGGYRVEHLLEAFTTQLDKDTVKRLKEEDTYRNNELIGRALQNRDGHCRNLLRVLMKNFKEEQIYAEEHNHVDNETYQKFYHDGKIYWAFPQE